MPRVLCLHIFALALSISWSAAAADNAGDDEKIVGSWERLHEKENEKNTVIEETWTIKKTKDSWSVSGKFYTPGKGEVGNFRGKNVKFADGSLTFTQEFFKLPEGFVSGMTVSCGATEDRLDVAFKPKNGEETRDNFKRAGDGSDIIGKWKNTTKSGVTEAWMIEKDKKGNLIVRGEMSDKSGTVTHAFNGVNVRYFMKQLFFNQNFYKSPPNFQNPGTAIVCMPRDKQLFFVFYNGRAKGKGFLKLDSK